MSTDKERLCFVLMPFSDALQEVYAKAIKPACEKAGFRSLRVDELKGAFNINRKIIEHIFTSDAIIADLTGGNPNVFYEVGVAHAIDNKTIMITQSQSQLPFDVSGYNCLIYDATETGLERLKNTIAETLSALDEWRRHPTNPVQEFKPCDALVSRGVLESPQEGVRALQTQIMTLQQRLHEEYPSKIFLEETFLDPLLWHIRYRRKEDYKKNPVELDRLGLSCRTTENKGKYDVHITYRITGRNAQDERLAGLQLIIVGDTPVPLAKLNPKLYHLHLDPQKRNKVKPELLGPDGKLKVLFLPFISPGIEKSDSFDIEFSYTWPNLVYSDSPKDCFFIDNFDFANGTHEIQIDLEFEGLEIGAVNAFAVDSFLREQRLGAVLPDDAVPARFSFRRKNPESDKYFVLVFEILKTTQ